MNAGQVPIGEHGPGPLTVSLPPVAGDEVEDDDWTLHVEVAGRPLDLPFHPRRAVREAVARAGRALDAAAPALGVPASWLDPTSAETVEYLRGRLSGFVAKGDGDTEAELDDARELDELSTSLQQERDPYIGARTAGDGSAVPWRTGAMRRAYRSPADGRLAEFAVYVPPDFDPARSYPLVVALHGMNGRPLEMIMWLFGHDDPARDGDWEDRHPVRDLAPLRAIVVAPSGHSNTMYRELGEDDVMRVVRLGHRDVPHRPVARSPSRARRWAASAARRARCTTPVRFAAAAPLCGYHSYFVRGDISGRGMRPWERFIAEERSNVFWAENGLYLPLYVVHGTKDLPEENSGVLIDRYEELHYAVKHEHPELGHNVWQTTYEDLKGAHWLLGHRRPLHPRAVRFKTARHPLGGRRLGPRARASVERCMGRGHRANRPGQLVYAATTGVAALSLDRDTERIDDAAPVSVIVDGTRLTFEAGEPIEMHREAAGRLACRTYRPPRPVQARHRDGAHPRRVSRTGPLRLGGERPGPGTRERGGRPGVGPRPLGRARRLPDHERRRVLRPRRAARERPGALPRRQRRLQPARPRARAGPSDPDRRPAT